MSSTTTDVPAAHLSAAHLTEFAQFFERQPDLADAVTEVVEAALEMTCELTYGDGQIDFINHRLGLALDAFLTLARSEI